MYDYLVVGAGLYGATFAHEAKQAGKSVLVIEKRNHIAGNAYTEEQEGIMVHRYGPHIFHSSNKTVWEYLQQFTSFIPFENRPLACYRGEKYSLPFNMYTFEKLWGVTSPEKALAILDRQRNSMLGRCPQNLEEQAIALVGEEIYRKLIQGYTEKQWGRDCKELPAEIIRRIPVRMIYDDQYYNDIYQGIPNEGYTRMISNMLEGIEVCLEEDYLEKKEEYDALAKKVVYTGPIDAYFGYKLGALAYRTVSFELILLNQEYYQERAVINYTDRNIPWTRIIEHKCFTFGKDINGEKLSHTIISKEYSSEWEIGKEPSYPINDVANMELYSTYKKLAKQEKTTLFGGRLGEYRYYDMDEVVAAALACAHKELQIV